MAKHQKFPLQNFTDKQQFFPLSNSVTDFSITTFNHMWAIKNFRVIPFDEEYILSVDFSPPNSKDKWFMKLRPLQFNETNDRYIGIHLFLRSCEDENKRQLRAKYAISVLDAEGKTKFTGECSKADGRIFKAGTEGHGYRLLAPLDILLNADQNILGTEDTLQVLCKITVFGDIKSKLIPKLETDLYTKEEMAVGCLSSNLSALWSSQEGSDIIVETIDGVQLKAHKLLLKSRSKVFAAMLKDETNEKDEEKITVPEYEAVVKEMIHFMYTDDVADIGDIAGDLLTAADKYDLLKLKKICEQYLAANLN